MSKSPINVQRCYLWGLLWWRSPKMLWDGQPDHLVFDNLSPILFKTRLEARKYAEERYGYIKKRKDLLSYPHHWRMPKAIKITGIIWRRPQ